MRDELVGHLLGALDAPDSQRIEAALGDPDSGPPLRRDLEILRRSFSPLASDRAPIPAPIGLADRMLRMIAEQRSGAPGASAAVEREPFGTLATTPSQPASPPTPAIPHDRRPAPRPQRSVVPGDGGASETRTDGATWIDKAILAATALAACILVFPALAQLSGDARRTQTERRLGKLGQALHGYASSHRRYPSPPDGGPMSRGGLYAPLLVSERRIGPNDGSVLVPGSPLSVSGTFRVPTIDELKAAIGTPAFSEMVNSMGGDFGYTLGHRGTDGTLQPIRGLHRRHESIMGDAPDRSCERSSNHPTGIHHFLQEDGSVKTLMEEELHDGDHVYRNRDGKTAAGTDEDDTVIGASPHQP